MDYIKKCINFQLIWAPINRLVDQMRVKSREKNFPLEIVDLAWKITCNRKIRYTSNPIGFTVQWICFHFRVFQDRTLE